MSLWLLTSVTSEKGTVKRIVPSFLVNLSSESPMSRVPFCLLVMFSCPEMYSTSGYISWALATPPMQVNARGKSMAVRSKDSVGRTFPSVLLWVIELVGRSETVRLTMASKIEGETCATFGKGHERTTGSHASTPRSGASSDNDAVTSRICLSAVVPAGILQALRRRRASCGGPATLWRCAYGYEFRQYREAAMRIACVGVAALTLSVVYSQGACRTPAGAGLRQLSQRRERVSSACTARCHRNQLPKSDGQSFVASGDKSIP